MTDRELPTGTLTFLFSDMEGSTRLVQELGPGTFAQVLEQHNAILRNAFGRCGGIERGTQGDSFLVPPGGCAPWKPPVGWRGGGPASRRPMGSTRPNWRSRVRSVTNGESPTHCSTSRI